MTKFQVPMGTCNANACFSPKGDVRFAQRDAHSGSEWPETIPRVAAAVQPHPGLMSATPLVLSECRAMSGRNLNAVLNSIGLSCIGKMQLFGPRFLSVFSVAFCFNSIVPAREKVRQFTPWKAGIPWLGLSPCLKEAISLAQWINGPY